MLRYFLISLCVAIALNFSTGSQAYFATGNNLYSDCTSDKSASTYYQDQTACIGYVAGVVDTVILHSWSQDKDMCSSIEGLTVRQAKDITIKYLKERPRARNVSAAALIIDALKKAYPACDSGLFKIK